MQGEKISLSLKQLKNDPWLTVAEKYHKGDTVRGKVTKFNPFGAFIGFDGPIQGLVHISEFGTELRMKEEIETGKEYDFKVLLVDPKEHRMSLGMVREEKEAGSEKEGDSSKSAEEQNLTSQEIEP
jgi:small subunit ribosomal protein S1